MSESIELLLASPESRKEIARRLFVPLAYSSLASLAASDKEPDKIALVDGDATPENNGWYKCVDDQGSIAYQKISGLTDGADGADGLTPSIGINGNWYLGDVDTGVPAIGQDGQDAYDLAVSEGFSGSEIEWLASLQGADGEPGAAGADGAPGSTVAGARGYATKSGMEADTAQDDGTLGKVTNDPTPANNGWYRWDNGLTTWVKSDLPDLTEEYLALERKANLEQIFFIPTSVDATQVTVTPTFNANQTRRGVDVTWNGGIMVNRRSGVAGWTNFRYLRGPAGTNFISFPAENGFKVAVISNLNFSATTEINMVIKERDQVTEDDIVLMANYQNSHTLIGPLAAFFYNLYHEGRINQARKQLNHPGYDAALNWYPNIYEKLPKFVKKYTAGVGSTADDYVKIVFVGSSITARTHHTSASDPASESPPSLNSQNYVKQLYDRLELEKPVYRRYDYDSFFSETGDFSTVGSFNDSPSELTWDVVGQVFPYRVFIDSETRISESESASISFEIPDTHNRFNFLDRTEVNGCEELIINVTGGDGLLEVKAEGDETWSEANGYTFSQLQVADYDNLVGNTVYQRRHYFRKVGAAIDAAQALSVTKNVAGSSRLLYWGVEMVRGDQPYNIMVNVARGSNSMEQLRTKLRSDVVDRNPDLVVFQLSMGNTLGGVGSETWTKENYIAQFHDIIWGDRPGHENALSLKNLSNNWQDFELLIVLPHFLRSHLDSTTGEPRKEANNISLRDIHNACKALLYEKGDLFFIDISSAFLRYIEQDLDFANAYDAMTGSSVTGNTYTTDTMHQNDKGTKVYVRQLAPIFNTTNL